MSERLSSVLKRLSVLSGEDKPAGKVIYEEKELSSPNKILEEIKRLKHLRYTDFQGLFLTEVRNMFVDRYPLDTTLKKKQDIDPNKLIALIFTLSPPFDLENREEIAQYEISLLQETLKGERTDFLEGKKTSSFIIPAYLILRSLKEKDSYWLITTFKNMPSSERKKLKENVQEILDKIIGFLPEEKRKEFLWRFGIDLGWLYSEYHHKVEFKKAQTDRPDSPKKKKERLAGLSDDELEIKPLAKNEEKELLLTTRIFIRNFYLSDNGKINPLDRKKGLVKKEIKSPEKIKGTNLRLEDSLFDRLTRILGENDIRYFSLLYSISPFSLEGLTDEKIKKINGLFKKGLEMIFTDPSFCIDLEKALNNDYENLWLFPNFNRSLALVLYKIAFPEKAEKISEKDLNDFFKESGNANVIFALRKIFFLKKLRESFDLSFKKLKVDANLDYLLRQINLNEFRKRFVLDKGLLTLKDEKLLALILAFNLEDALRQKKDDFGKKFFTDYNINVFFHQGIAFPIGIEIDKRDDGFYVYNFSFLFKGKNDGSDTSIGEFVFKDFVFENVV